MFGKILRFLRTKSFRDGRKFKLKNAPMLLTTLLTADAIASEEVRGIPHSDYLLISDEKLYRLNEESEHALNRFMHFLTGCVIETSKRYRILLKQQLEFIEKGELTPEQIMLADAINNRLQLLKKSLDRYDRIIKNVGYMAYNQAISSYLSGNVQAEEVVCINFSKLEQLVKYQFEMNNELESKLKFGNTYANTIIPPPYSSAASLEEININGNADHNPTRSCTDIPRSISVVTSNTFHLAQHSPSGSSQNAFPSLLVPQNKEVSITSNPCYMQQSDVLQGLPNISGMSVTTCSTSSNVSDSDELSANTTLKSKPIEIEKGYRQYNINKFSELLNLSVCTSNNINNIPMGISTSSRHDLHQYSVANSMTSSDVSSLANLSTPDSPPQATSPTAELRELLDKIQQLPQRKSPENPPELTGRSCFGRSKAKTLYMPLNEVTTNRLCSSGKTVAIFGKSSKNWLSRSAPNTPCGNFVPSFPVTKKHCDIKRGSRGKISDGSPLLNEHEESDEELPRQHYL